MLHYLLCFYVDHIFVSIVMQLRMDVIDLFQFGWTLVLQGWVTLQLTRDPSYSRGFLSARSVTGFLADVYPAAADEVGKIYLIADGRVCI